MQILCKITIWNRNRNWKTITEITLLLTSSCLCDDRWQRGKAFIGRFSVPPRSGLAAASRWILRWSQTTPTSCVYLNCANVLHTVGWVSSHMHRLTGWSMYSSGVLPLAGWREVWRPSVKVDPGAFSGQRQGWKTPKRTPWQCTASVCVAGVYCWDISLG